MRRHERRTQGVDTVHTAGTKGQRDVPHVRVAIVGAGFGGLGAAIRLRQAGVDDLVVLERDADIGGTWWANRYPGAACDVQSRLYEFAFAPNPHWSRRFADQPEILEYLRWCAETFDVRRHVRLRHDVRSAEWDEARHRWIVTTSRDTWTADVLVAAAGPLAEPRIPAVPGLGTFAGQTLHTAQWDDTVDVAGRRVAVVGTGASAIQVVPAIEPDVERLTLLQRTPPWVLPRFDRALSPTAGDLLRRVPLLHRILRAGLYLSRELLGLPFRHPWMALPVEALARAHLRRQVDDPRLRVRLTPDYRIGCKRVLLSDDYYPALQQPDVTVTGALTEVRPHGVVDAAGVERPADVLVFATGFRATEYPFGRRIRGRDGRRLSDVWTPSIFAHLGTTVAGFPNLFVLLGPNTGLGHNSVVLMIEAQLEHLVSALTAMDAHGATAVEPWPEAQQAWLDEVADRMASTVWTTGGCDSWYLDATGRNTTLWPGSVGAFRRRVAPFDPTEYRMRRASAAAPPRDGLRSASFATPTRVDVHDPSTDTAGVPSGAADEAEPSMPQRAQGAVARAVLPRLSDRALERLGGGPAVVDGARLDPASRLVVAARPDRLTAGTPPQARARYRTEVLSAVGRPTPVRAVRDLVVDGAAGALPARHYLPEAPAGRAPLLLYLHGGGFALGDLDTHDEPCRLLCAVAGQSVLSVAYRLAPEHPFPAAADDAVAALRWAQAHASELGAGATGTAGREPAATMVAVGGDSAGANLATVAAIRTRDEAPPCAQLLIYPATDRSRRRPSHDRFDGWFLATADVDRFAEWYHRAAGVPDGHPGVSPLCVPDLAGLAPAYTVTAGFDVLRDEGVAYAAALASAGTPSVHDHEPALGHGFLHLTQVSDAARCATVRLAQRWRTLLHEGWPT